MEDGNSSKRFLSRIYGWLLNSRPIQHSTNNEVLPGLGSSSSERLSISKRKDVWLSYTDTIGRQAGSSLVLDVYLN